MDATSPTVLLAAEYSLVRAILLEILETHGYTVLTERCGLSATVIGHSYRHPIHLLVADGKERDNGRGHAIADNLSVLRPRMQAVYFEVEGGMLWLAPIAGYPGARDKIPFTPAAFLNTLDQALSEAYA